MWLGKKYKYMGICMWMWRKIKTDRQRWGGGQEHNCSHPGEWYIVRIFPVSIGLKCLKRYEERWESPYPLERHTEMIINEMT